MGEIKSVHKEPSVAMHLLGMQVSQENVMSSSSNDPEARVNLKLDLHTGGGQKKVDGQTAGCR